MSKHQQQADRKIHEDPLLNFLNLSNNAEVDTKDLYEVFVGATADGTSISTLCNSSEDLSSANTILYHLRTKFEPFRLERVSNTPLRRDIVELLPEQVVVCADLHLRPYYGDEDETDALCHSEAKRGTTAFHAYATLYARLWWWPYKKFVNMVRRAAWTALAMRRAVPANRPSDDRFYR